MPNIKSLRLSPKMLISNEDLLYISDQRDEALICLDQEGIVVFWNQAAEILFGYSTEEAVGKLLSDLVIPEPYLEQHKEGLERFKKYGLAPIVGSYRMVPAKTRLGEEKMVELRVSLCKMKDGRSIFTTLVRDMSSMDRFDRFIRSNPDGH